MDICSRFGTRELYFLLLVYCRSSTLQSRGSLKIAITTYLKSLRVFVDGNAVNIIYFLSWFAEIESLGYCWTGVVINLITALLFELKPSYALFH